MKYKEEQNLSTGFSKKRTTIFTAIALLAIFLAVYSLTYSGTFVTDDEHILTSRSLSLAFDKELNLSRVIGNSRVFNYSLSAPLQAQQVANIEPLQTILGAGLASLSIFLNVGRIQTLFLLNIWTTALTAAVIYLTARKRNCTNRVGIILSLLFGLCTIAFPYSQTYFRDSLAMLFIACLWYFSESIRKNQSSPTSAITIRLWVGLFISGVLGVLSKNTVLIAFPVVFLEIIIQKRTTRAQLKRTHFKSLWALVGGGLCLALFWFLVVPKIPILARFSPAYYWSLLVYFISTPHPNMVQALAGPFISSGKSIFLFSPILIFSIWSLFYRFKSSWSSLLYLALLVIGQALFYDAEWAGHINWGLRFVLPAIPPLVLSIDSLIEKLLNTIIGIIGLVVLALISFSIQLLAIVAPIGAFFTEKASSSIPISEQTLIWDIHQSPIWWSVNWILKRQPWNLAIIRVKGEVVILLVLVILAIVFACISLKIERTKYLAIAAVLIAISVNVSMLFIYRNDPAYFRSRIDLQSSQSEIESNYHPGDLILLKSYGTSSWKYWMNWTGTKEEWTALPFYYPTPILIEQFKETGDPQVAMDRITLMILTQQVQSGRRVWLILPADTPGADLGIEEAWLEARSGKSFCRIIRGDSDTTKLCYYEIK